MELNDVQRAAQQQFAQQSKRYGAGHILADISDSVEALRQVELPVPARVLDVAAGAGHTGLHLASLGHDVILSDLAEPMLERVREAAAARNLAVQTRQHPAEELPYPEAAFDLVTSRVAPHHFSSPGAFVREAARVLKPGGWFLLIDGSVPDDDPAAEEWLHRVEKLRDPSHHRFLSRRAWTELCGKAGLTVRHSALSPRQQPDLEWYFETANTSPENRQAVRELIAHVPEGVRSAYRLTEEAGKTVWWWPMAVLVARK